MSQRKNREQKESFRCIPSSLLAAGLISLLVMAAHVPASAAQETAGGKLELFQMEEQLFSLVNIERRVQELKELTLDPGLSEAARRHSEKMAAEKNLSNEFPGYDPLDARLSTAGLYFNAAGDNIAFSRSYVVRFVHQALVESPGHRQNMLNARFTHIGIGVVQVEDGYYITQVFARLFKPQPPAEMVRILEAELDQNVTPAAGRPLVFLDWMADVPKRSAEDALQGLPARRPPDTLGKCTLMNISFFDVMEAAAALEKQILNEKAEGVSLSVIFGRGQKYPGGVYVASALLFPAAAMSAFEEQELPQRLFQKINSLRQEQGLEPFRLSPKLSGEAQTAARAYYENPEGPYRSTMHSLVVAYQSDGLHLTLPPDVGQKLMNLSGQLELGISVYYPIQHRLPGNYLIVALVAE